MDRKAKILRKTKETSILVELNIDGAGIAGVAIAPNPRQELLAGEHATGPRGQELEELKLLARQLEHAAPKRGLDRNRVDDQIAQLDLVAPRRERIRPDPARVERSIPARVFHRRFSRAAFPDA